MQTEQTWNLPPLTPGSSCWFLVREVRTALEELQNLTNPAVLNLVASRGGGKTTFLAQIEQALAGDDKYALLGAWDAGQTTSEELARSIHTSILGASPGLPCVALIDNLDSLWLKGDGEAFFELERDLIVDLVEDSRTLIVGTGLMELLPWRDNEVIYRQKSLRLPALNLSDVRAALHCSEAEAESVFEVTMGHPEMVHRLAANPSLSAEEIAESARDYFLEKLSPGARSLAMVASLMPAFNVLALRKALGKDDQERQDLLNQYTDQIEEIARQGMVLWELQIGAYRFTDSAVRRLLARAFRDEEPERFQAIQQVEARYFGDEARGPAYLHQHLVSAIYHLAQAGRSFGQHEAARRVIDWIDDHRQSWQPANWDRVLSAWETGAGEPAVRVEIEQLIGKAACGQITHWLEQNQKEEVKL